MSGVLWLLDEMVAFSAVGKQDAARALQAMLHYGARLPHDECEKRLLRWLATGPPRK